MTSACSLIGEQVLFQHKVWGGENRSAEPRRGTKALLLEPHKLSFLAHFRAAVEGGRIERRKSVVERDVEAARALRAHSSVLAGDAEGDQRLRRGFERVLLRSKEAA